MTLAAYPKYLETGCDWPERLPAEWNVKWLKWTCDLDTKKSDDTSGERPYLGLENVESWTGRLLQDSEHEPTGDCLQFEPYHVLFGKLRPYLAKAAMPAFSGRCTGEFLVLNPKDIKRRYLFWYLLSPEFVARVDGSTFGAKMPRADWRFIGHMPIPIPPEVEQDGLADYLDRETGDIDNLISEKSRLIGLLEEKRMALTNLALKESESNAVRFCSVADRVNRRIQRCDEEEYVPIGLFNYGRGLFHKNPVKGRDLGDSRFFYVEDGDLILSGQFAWEGAVALARKDDAGCVVSHRYPVFTAKSGVAHPGYLLSFFRTDTGHMLLNHHSRGAAGRNRPLNDRTLMKEKIPIPPIEVQEEIGGMLEREVALRAAVASSNELLRERRAALVSAAVTGRIDVREEAP
jgi:type I restriction enzyme, S subunit